MAKTITKFKLTEIGEIPADWSIRSIGELCSRRKEQIIPTNTGINRYVGLEHLDPGFSLIRRWGNEIGLRSAKNKFELGDVLYGKLRPYLDKSAVAEWTGVCSTDILVLSPLKNECVPQYLGFLLHISDFLEHAKATTKGVNHPRTSWDDIKRFNCGIPQKPEQERIAGVLSKIQKAVENQEKIVGDLRELKAATLSKLFREGLRGEPLKQTEIGEIPKSWATMPLGSVCAETNTLNPAKTPDKVMEYVDVSSISREECRIVSSTKYLGKDAPGRARNLVRHGDVIFATVRPTLRRVAIVPQELDGQLVSTAFCVMRAIEQKAHPEYLFYMVSSADFIARVGRLERGANYPAVTNGNVLAQIIALPKYEEQKEIAAAINVIDKNLSIAVKKHAQFNSVFSSTLNQLMTGKVRIKE